MEEERKEPAEAAGQPQSGQGSPREPRRDGRRNRPRHQGGRRDQHRHENPQQAPRPQHPRPPVDKEPDAESDDDEDEPRGDRSSQRRHFRGGRPPKKIIEEWANDIYCE